MDWFCCLRNNRADFCGIGPPSQASLLSSDRGSSKFSINRMFRLSFNLQDACAATIWSAWRDEDGQGVSEYAIVMSMVVLLALVGLSFISSQVLDTLRKVVAALQ